MTVSFSSEAKKNYQKSTFVKRSGDPREAAIKTRFQPRQKSPLSKIHAKLHQLTVTLTHWIESKNSALFPSSSSSWVVLWKFCFPLAELLLLLWGYFSVLGQLFPESGTTFDLLAIFWSFFFFLRHWFFAVSSFLRFTQTVFNFFALFCSRKLRISVPFEEKNGD